MVVRTLDDTDIDALKQAGAAEVVAEIMEGSLMLASHALMLVGVPFNRVLRRIRETREQRYGLFRGFFRGVTDETGEERDRTQPRLHSVPYHAGRARAGAQRCARSIWRALGVEVTAVRRRRVRSEAPRSRHACWPRTTCSCCAGQEECAGGRRDEADAG